MTDLTKLEECRLSNGNIQYFQIVDGMAFEKAIKLKSGELEEYPVDDNLINSILHCYNSRYRVRLWSCGDDGIAWEEEFDVTGRIGKSCGNRFKIPLLIHDSRSYGGGAILTGRIGRIDIIASHRTIYKKDNFKIPEYKIISDSNTEYPYSVYRKDENGEWHNTASFKKESQAIRWIDFMTGRRYCK